MARTVGKAFRPNVELHEHQSVCRKTEVNRLQTEDSTDQEAGGGEYR